MKKATATLLLTLLAALSVLAQTEAVKTTETKPPTPATPTTPAIDAPTADQIIEKYVQAIGGKAALEKMSSRVSKGTFEIPAMGVNGTAENYKKAPNKEMTLIVIPGFGEVRQGFDGSAGWAQEVGTDKFRDLEGDELTATRIVSDFSYATKLKEFYPKMTVKGKETVAGREAYVVEATPEKGSATKLYFDAETSLLVRADAQAATPHGYMMAEEYYEDYREVDGIKLPHTYRRSTPELSFTIKYSEIKNNVAIDDAKFAKPAAK